MQEVGELVVFAELLEVWVPDEKVTHQDWIRARINMWKIRLLRHSVGARLRADKWPPREG